MSPNPKPLNPKPLDQWKNPKWLGDFRNKHGFEKNVPFFKVNGVYMKVSDCFEDWRVVGCFPGLEKTHELFRV